MSLEDTELKIGGTSFKGVWIAIVLGIGTSIGGTVWTASSLYSRLEAVEAVQIPDIVPLKEQIALIETQLRDNNVSQLQGKLAELGVNLKTIAEQQTKLIIQDWRRVSEMEQKLIAIETVVEKAELDNELGKYDLEEMAKTKREIQDIWDGMDYLSNPLN